MKIFILTMDEPLYTNPFVRKILDARKGDIVGLALSKGDRLTVGKNRSQMAYLLSLFIILGLVQFGKHSLTSAIFKLKLKLSKKFPFIKSPSIVEDARSLGIKTYHVQSVNEEAFVNTLREEKPDIIVSQTQNIIKKDLLSIPRIGVINRHNALLPRNRGRLSPFWVLYREETETGVSIHFVNEGIDADEIIVQEKFPVSDRDNIASIVRRNYEIAPQAMLQAIDMLEAGTYIPIKNDEALATYNTIPTLKQAIDYRLSRIKKRFSA